MQIDLNRLGSAGEYLDAVEQALDEHGYSTARDALDRADLELEAARSQWREAEGPQRALLGTMGKTVGVDAYVAKFDPVVLADTLRPLLQK